MEVVLAVLVLGAFVGIYFLMGKAGRGFSRVIQPKAHREGKQLVKEGLSFTAPGTPAEVVAKIRSSVNAYQTPPAFMPGLYEQPVDDTSVAFSFGSKVTTVFAGLVICRADGLGVRGQFDILKWTESGGIVARREEIKRLHERIRAAVESLGGSAASVTE